VMKGVTALADNTHPSMMIISMLAMFWAASLTVANWATIIHHTVKKGSKSPISGVGPYYLGSNLLICTMVIVCGIGLRVSTGGTEAAKNWALVGQLTLAIPELVLAITATVYGMLLIQMIRTSMKKFSGSEEHKRRQLTACRKTAGIFVTFAVTFILQATLDLIAGAKPSWYYYQGTGEDVLPVAPADLTHAACSVFTNVIIIFVVVKYEEITQVAAEVASPVVMLVRKVSAMVPSSGYAKVPDDDDLKTSAVVADKKPAISGSL